MTENQSNEIQAEIAGQLEKEDSDFASRQAEVQQELADHDYVDQDGDDGDHDRYYPTGGEF